MKKKKYLKTIKGNSRLGKFIHKIVRVDSFVGNIIYKKNKKKKSGDIWIINLNQILTLEDN